MSTHPEPIQQLHDALRRLSGVRGVELGVRSLEGIGERELSLPGEFGDLPHLALRRTNGALRGEVLVSAELQFRQDREGWIALEFLAWWVRDLSRAGRWVQMRPLALPPVAYERQLGRTLKCVIEFFFPNGDDGKEIVFQLIGEHAGSLNGNIDDYAEALAHPVYPDDDDLDVPALRREAEAGNTAAQLALARRCEEGDGVEQDPAEAVRWYQRAAKQGQPHALMALGLCYAEGRGVEPDAERAAACYRKAADAGLPLAMGLLGACYEKGAGVAQNLAEAASWYRRGADHGEACCQAELGECYEHGKGVERDPREALKWYRQALAQGFEPVQPAIARVEADLE